MTWNSLNADNAKVVLLPLLWERAVVPRSGDRPQAIINRQIVDECDALIGIFWTRLGSPTGAANSGTEEEINRVLASRKPVSLYFSRAPIDPNFDLEQKTKLDAFKQRQLPRGVIHEFSSSEDLALKFAHHINSLGRELAGDAAPLLLDVGRGQEQGQFLQMITDHQVGWGHPTMTPMTGSPAK